MPNRRAYLKLELSENDWSDTSEDFKICVAALREDIEEVIRLMPMVVSNHSINREAFRDWPLFDAIRENIVFSRKFEEVFGEPLQQIKRPVSVELPEGDSYSLDGETVH